MGTSFSLADTPQCLIYQEAKLPGVTKLSKIAK